MMNKKGAMELPDEWAMLQLKNDWTGNQGR
jgi:hypothetical protein